VPEEYTAEHGGHSTVSDYPQGHAGFAPLSF